MPQFHDEPAAYLELMRDALPGYDRLQAAVVAASADLHVDRLLDLGTGTGETARRCLRAHPGAVAVVTDEKPQMLRLAAATLGPSCTVHQSRLQEPLPAGPFDLVVSALAVHHLKAAGKTELFCRVAEVLRDDGRLVVGDVVMPDEPVETPSPIDPAVDHPERIDDLLRQMSDAGLRPGVAWTENDLAVISATR